MNIHFFCPLWGSDKLGLPNFLKKAREAGYDGVEMGLPLDPVEKQNITGQIKEEGLLFIAQHFETRDSDFDTHKNNFEKRMYNLADANPKFINSQTGKDYFSFEQNLQLLEIAKAVSEQSGVKIVHETHRGKFSFAIHITREYLSKLPWLRLTLDMSHWCNVAESLLKDQLESLELAISRTDHLHARIGHTQSPQVNDPRAAEWEETNEMHLWAWDKVIELAIKNGWEHFTITPEFGPYPYMPEMPYTRKAVADQWEINVFMKDLLKMRYQEVMGS